MESSFDALPQVGEEMPQSVGDAKLSSEMQATDAVLDNMTDDYILNEMPKSNEKKVIALQKIYSNLADLLHFVNPSLPCAVSLRMVDLTLKSGLTSVSPLAFAYYGEILIACEKFAEGCRLGVCLLAS